MLTPSGKCYTFNGASNTTWTQRVPGSNGGLFVVLNVRNWEYTEDPIYGQKEAGILFQVHTLKVVCHVSCYYSTFSVALATTKPTKQSCLMHVTLTAKTKF